MWKFVQSHSPTPLGWLCAVLAVVIPAVIYQINSWLHRLADPPWKR